jgi:hydrophobe/amphiphile efflux-3 (HAE3) family protein
MDRVFRVIVNFPKLVILIAFALTFYFALQLPKLKLETDVDAYVPDEHPAMKYQKLVEDIFNYSESMVIAVVNEGPDGIFNRTTLERIERLTEKISRVEYVSAQRDEDVKSISTMDNIIGVVDGIEVVPLMESIPETREELERLKEHLYGNEMFVGWLVSEDRTMALILAKIVRNEDWSDDSNLRSVYAECRKIVEEERGGDDQLYIAGQPVLEATFVDFILGNLKVMLPIVVTVIIVLLYLSLGNLRGIVLPLLVVSAGVIWSMGIMSMVNVPIYDMTTMTPVILMAIGCAYGIHILNRYRDEAIENPDREKKAIVLQTMLSIWPPVVMSSLTTAVGFASLSVSSLTVIQSFGIFTGVGIVCALIFSLTFIPAGLMLMKVPDSKAAGKSGNVIKSIFQDYTSQALDLMGRRVYRYRIAICTLFAAIVLLCVPGFFKVRVDESWLEMFDHDSEVYIANNMINEKMNGVVSLNVVVEGDKPDAIKSPSVLKKMDGLQEYIEEMEEVGGVISIVNYIRRMNKVMNEDREEFDRVPDTREAIAQYLLLYSISGDPDDFDEVVDYNYQQANMTVIMKNDHTASVKKVTDRIDLYVKEHFRDKSAQVNLTGYAFITEVVVDLAVNGMLASIVMSILVIYIMTATMFRSFTGGIYNVIPITMAMLLNIGLLGMLNVPIGFNNSVAFAVAMGVGVDYAIHLVFRFQKEAAETEDLSEVIAVALKTSGKAILFNAVVVTAGFLVLTASNFTGHLVLGWLLSLSMLASFVGSVTLLPAAMGLFRPSFAVPKKDTFQNE